MTRIVRGLRALALGGATLLLAGCYRVSYDMDALNHVPAPGGAVVEHFRFEATNPHWIFGIVSPSQPRMVGGIVERVRKAGGAGVKNLKVTHQFGIVDIAFTLVTMGIYAPTTVIVEGDVVR